MEKIYELLFNIGLNDQVLDILNIFILNNSVAVWLLSLLLFLLIYLLRFAIIKLVEGTFKSFSSKTKTDIDDQIILVIEKPIRWLILLFGFSLSLSILDIEEELNYFIHHILQSIVILLLSWLVLRSIGVFSSNILALSNHIKSEIAESLIKLLITIVKTVIIIITIMIILSKWGFNISGFIASLGLVGMAFALAAKDTASNLFGSIVILSDRPFNIGDWIKTPEVEGIIEEIGMRSTKVRTFAQALVSVPNGVLANSAILNYSRMEKRRIKMNLGLTYATSATQMQNILDEIRSYLQSNSEIHPETIYIYFTEFNNSSLDIFCYFFTNTTNWSEYMAVRERVNLELMKIIEKNNASFAFPSQSIYIEDTQNTID